MRRPAAHHGTVETPGEAGGIHGTARDLSRHGHIGRKADVEMNRRRMLESPAPILRGVRERGPEHVQPPVRLVGGDAFPVDE
jgi:hypothetical protein